MTKEGRYPNVEWILGNSADQNKLRMRFTAEHLRQRHLAFGYLATQFDPSYWHPICFNVLAFIRNLCTVNTFTVQVHCS
jgi:hypothetical protein